MTTNTKILIFSLIFATAVAVFEGDSCIMLNGVESSGICTKFDKCDYAKQLLREKHIHPQVCGFRRRNSLVCCPSSSQKLRLKSLKSEKKCQHYHNIRNLNPSIAFGEQALPREFPHMAALGYGNDTSNKMWLCGGSLISNKFVLTAAHCIKNLNFGSPNWVRLGDLVLNDTNDDAAPQDIEVAAISVHPDYKYPSHYNDIALIRLKRAVTFTSNIRPACLHTNKTLPSGQLEAIGWGTTDYFSGQSYHLLKVFLNVIEHDKCAKIYSSISTRKLAYGIVDDSQICAGDVSGKDTCPGDSGGPLHFKKEFSGDIVAYFVVVGVTSFGKGCGFENSAGVYTRVSQYRSWIEDIVWP